MQTVTIQIGNSDDKLSQRRWADFIFNVDQLVGQYCADIHFHGFSPGDTAWQNACWVAQIRTESVKKLETDLTVCRKNYDQESIAFTIGNTTFI